MTQARSPGPDDSVPFAGLEEWLGLETKCGGGASAEGYCLCVSSLGGGLGWRGECFLAFS